MSKFERLLVPGSTEKPDCQCGAEMHLVPTNSLRQSADVEIAFRTVVSHPAAVKLVARAASLL